MKSSIQGPTSLWKATNQLLISNREIKISRIFLIAQGSLITISNSKNSLSNQKVLIMMKSIVNLCADKRQKM